MRIARIFYLNRVLVILVLVVTSLNGKAQQGPQFTQFMYNNLVINPAYAGTEGAFSLTMISRNQWSGVDKAPTTQSFSAHTLVKEKNIGLGVTILRDEIGVHRNLTALTSFAYHIKIKEQTFLSMGLQAGVANLKSDYASLPGSSNDPKLTNSINETTLDIGAGIYYRSPRLHLGLSMPELMSRAVNTSDTISINFRRNTVLAYSRYRIPLSATFDAEPGLLVKYFPGLPLSYDVNLNFIYRRVLTVGVSYRKGESVDFIFKFQLTPQFQFGYAYDYPMSNSSRLGSGSHEIMIHYVFRNIHKGVATPR